MADKEIGKSNSARLIEESKELTSNDSKKTHRPMLSTKNFKLPQFKIQDLERKKGICEKLDLLISGPIRKESSFGMVSRRPSLSLRATDCLMTTTGLSKADKTYSNGFTNAVRGLSPKIPDPLVSLDSSNASPTQAFMTKEQKINIWGGNAPMEAHRRGRSFDILLR